MARSKSWKVLLGGGYCRRMGQDSPKQLGGGRTHVRYLRTHVRYHTYLPTYVQMYMTYDLWTRTSSYVLPSYYASSYAYPAPIPPFPIWFICTYLINLKLQLLTTTSATADSADYYLLPPAATRGWLLMTCYVIVVLQVLLLGGLDAWHRWWAPNGAPPPKLGYWGAQLRAPKAPGAERRNTPNRQQAYAILVSRIGYFDWSEKESIVLV